MQTKKEKKLVRCSEGNVYHFAKIEPLRPADAGGREAGALKHFARWARTMTIPEEEASRVRWLHERAATLACYQSEYVLSLFSKYGLDISEWEYNMAAGRFERKGGNRRLL